MNYKDFRESLNEEQKLYFEILRNKILDHNRTILEDKYADRYERLLHINDTTAILFGEK